MSDERGFVTIEECEKKRKENAKYCEECRKNLEKEIRIEHDTNIQQNASLKGISDTLSGAKKIGWWLAGLVGSTLVASLLNLILNK